MKNKILCLVLALVSITSHAAPLDVPTNVAPDVAPDVALKPLPQQSLAGNLAIRILAHENYEHLPLDEKFSGIIYDKYLDALDGQKSIYLQSDIDQFSRARPILGTSMLNEDLTIPFAMFNLRTQRITQHLNYARSLLKKGFHFEEQESYQPDRKNATWPKSLQEMHELWRKRVKNDWLRLKLAGKDDKGIIDTLDKRYENTLKSIAKSKSEDALQIYMDACAMAYDPHTNYFGVRASKEFDISMSLSLIGIGAELQYRDDTITIRHVVPGSPSALSGKLKAGDRILGVAQGSNGPMVDVIGMRIDDAVALIRGAEDTVVRLDVLPAEAGPDGAHRMISLIRKKITLEQQSAQQSVIDVVDGPVVHHVGIVTLPAFYRDFSAQKNGDSDFKSAARDVAQILAEFKKQHVDAVLIDLRNNGGGSLDEAVELTGLFVDRGPVVQMLDAKNQVAIDSINPKNAAVWRGPLGVLINRGSASASEIFAAAIQDYGRGVLIGETSFGKGTTQAIIDLDRIAKNDKPTFGELKMTNSKWFRANGDGIQLRGITPDVTLPMLSDTENFGESSYDNALPWSHIARADYKPAGNLTKIIPMLITSHNARIAKDQAFLDLEEDIAEFKTLSKKNLISLNEKERRKERETQQAKLKRREHDKPKTDEADSASRQDDGLQADERKIEADPAPDKKKDNDKDILLKEAAHILNDEVDILKTIY